MKSGGKRLKDLSDAGKAQLAEAIGLKKYLLDFSLIAERTINEIDIWQDYMVYAALFGIADKVLAQFKKVYPERITEFESYNRNVLISYSYYRTMLRSTEKAEQAARASGFGGAAPSAAEVAFPAAARAAVRDNINYIEIKRREE